MHIILRDQQNGSESIMCAERNSHTCLILSSDVDKLDKLIGMANSLHVDEVQIIVPPRAAEEMLTQGWTRTDLVVLSRPTKRKNGTQGTAS